MNLELQLALQEERVHVPRVATPIVPRMLFLAFDSFGEKVLWSLRDQHVWKLNTAKTRLTSLLRLQPNGVLAPLEQAPGTTPSAPISVSSIQPQQLINDLLGVRKTICAQASYDYLLSQGFHVSSYLEVVVVTRLTTVAEARLLEGVVNQIRSYLQRFEPTVVTAIVGSSEHELPAQEDERQAVVDTLNAILSATRRSSSGSMGAYLLDRCYVVTQETLRGHAIVTPHEIIQRCAGFLAAHYLTELREPMTSHQYWLFGEHAQSSREVPKKYGLCDVFGYAERYLDVDHILEWCARRQAQRVLSEVLLHSAAAGTVRPVPSLAQSVRDVLASAGLPVAATDVVSQILESAAQSSEHPPDPVPLRLRTLRPWQQYRESMEQALRDAAATVDARIATLQRQYQAFFASVVDAQLMDQAQGLAQTEQTLDAITAWCQIQTETLRPAPPARFSRWRHSADPLLETWRQLIRSLIIFPPLPVVIGRSATVLLLAAVAWIAFGSNGPWVSGLLAASVIAWLVFMYIWLPWRFQELQERLLKAIMARQHEQMRASVERALAAMFNTLQRQYEVTSAETVDAQVSVRQQVVAWRTKLRQASEQSAANARNFIAPQQMSDKAELVLPADQANVPIAAREYADYYERLTMWQPSASAKIFLAELHATGAGAWQSITAEQLSTQLVQTCRRQYQGQSHLEANSLEYHLCHVRGADEEQLRIFLDALIAAATPMARLQQSQPHLEPQPQRILVVHDPISTTFRTLAAERALHVVGGAHERQMICLLTQHHIPVRDLALAHGWQYSPEESQGAP